MLQIMARLLTFSMHQMGSTMLAIPRSDCGEDWPPGSFRRGSELSMSTLECKHSPPPNNKSSALPQKTSPALACDCGIIL